MKEGRREQSLTVILTVVCLVMLTLIGFRLYTVLSSPERTDADASQPFVNDVSADGLPGMVLIDIDTSAAAAKYHVSEPGVYVLAVDESSGAYLAGVRSGDRIVSANGVAVSASGELLDVDFPDGLTLLLSRCGREITILLDTGSQI